MLHKEYYINFNDITLLFQKTIVLENKGSHRDILFSE